MDRGEGGGGRGEGGVGAPRCRTGDCVCGERGMRGRADPLFGDAGAGSAGRACLASQCPLPSRSRRKPPLPPLFRRRHHDSPLRPAPAKRRGPESPRSAGSGRLPGRADPVQVPAWPGAWARTLAAALTVDRGDNRRRLAPGPGPRMTHRDSAAADSGAGRPHSSA
jgi:hypothetical protein